MPVIEIDPDKKAEIDAEQENASEQTPVEKLAAFLQANPDVAALVT